MGRNLALFREVCCRYGDAVRAEVFFDHPVHVALGVVASRASARTEVCAHAIGGVAVLAFAVTIAL